MAKRRFMYIPFQRTQAGDYHREVGPVQLNPRLAWGRMKDKDFEIVYFGATKAQPFKFDDDGADVAIYVRGHGAAGRGVLGNMRKKDPERKIIKHSVVFNGMKAAGLKPDFAGTIKFYNCHSAEGGDLSFAGQCSALFRDKGYKKAHFYGYIGSIGGTYKSNPDDGKPGDDDDIELHKWTKVQGKYERVKDHKVEF